MNYPKSSSELLAWHVENAPFYKTLGESAEAIISALCRAHKIDFLAVSHRVKSVESLTEKFIRKGYKTLEGMTDILGVRVIAYVESDVELIKKVLQGTFMVHPNQSVDKSEELAVDQVGYRSVHYICDLGEARTSLPEFKQFRSTKFEVQIRTVLQHAWAEIEHDRSYKFSGDLPPDLRRRLSLLAGSLELLDREFSAVAHDIDKYEKEALRDARAKTPAEQLISPVTVRDYFARRPPIVQLDPLSFSRPIEGAVRELANFGIRTIEELDQLLTSDFLSALARHSDKTTLVGVIRKAMMYSDVERYFTKSWKKSWLGLSEGTRALLLERWGSAKLESAFAGTPFRARTPRKPKSQDAT